MKIIIIDNEIGDASRLLDYCSFAFPDAIILPGRNELRTFSSDAEVHQFIKAIPNEKDVVLCMDMGLRGNHDYSDALQGKEIAASVRSQRPDWTIIAVTAFGRRIENVPDWMEIFDSIIDKADIDSRERHERITLIKAEITRAMTRHNPCEGVFPSHVRIKDSLGMRLFRAALGDESLADILRREAVGWYNVDVEALTSGHSGAYLLGLSGRSPDGPNSLIIKVALKPSEISNELSASDAHLSRLGDFLPTAQIDKTPRPLPERGAVYYRQARISGRTLLEEIKRQRWPQNRCVLQQVVSKYIAFCRAIPPDKAARKIIASMLKFSPVDVGRLETAVTFLYEFKPTLSSLSCWPKNIEDESAAQDLVALVQNWREDRIGTTETHCLVQHGDFHPGNIIIQSSNAPTLIDLARLGFWPFGYDMSRLALMLRLQLLDVQLHQDWFPERISEWLKEPLACGLSAVKKTTRLCQEALFCETEYYKFINTHGRKTTDDLLKAYAISSLYDTIKIVSYQDISPYKRIWALSEAVRLKAKVCEINSKGGGR